jgi:hypothetical protein
MDFRPRIKGNLKKAYESLTKKESRVLVIGDLHEPFSLEGYLGFCKEIYAKYNCNQVVFIGDVIDNHYSSYHETDADGMGGGEELDLAISNIARWYKAFPFADVTIGNHDRLVMRRHRQVPYRRNGLDSIKMCWKFLIGTLQIWSL